LKEAENIEQRLGLSDAGKKQIKYGTRALLLPSSLPISDEYKSEKGGLS
jgi:hypothetical protein